MKYVLNHYYILRHDSKRSIICAHHYKPCNVDVNTDWLSFIHPIYAMMLSFFCYPTTIKDAVKKISSFFDFPEEKTLSLISHFIENKEPFHTRYENHNNNFPKNVIVKETELEYQIRSYEPAIFAYSEVDFNAYRLYDAPLYVTFMVNNTCLTNCIYCYADKSTKSRSLDYSIINRVVDEAYTLNLSSFNLDGGEFFLYPYWRKLLRKLDTCEFRPEVISTKFPITEIDIRDFAKFEIRLQISLDSLNQTVLDQMVGCIPHYVERMKSTISLIDKYQPFQVATILTRYNNDIETLENMYMFLCEQKNITQWEIRVGFKSLYAKQSFEEIQIDRKDIKKIGNWILKKRTVSVFPIKWSPGHEVDFFKSENGSNSFPGSRCSANSRHLFILPDGKVTICEQLYWNKKFIIGDIKTQSLAEIWHSERELSLAYMKQDDYSCDSACRNCDIFDKCKSNMNSCYANILKVYGNEHWDFPDPRCAKAPRDISTNIYV